ncbi:MAG: hypothetical protein ACRELV_07500 [Longimicrobiales bacterium]
METEMQPSTGTDRFEARPCALALRDGRAVHGRISVPAGQTLVRFLRRRGRFLNLTHVNADWVEASPAPHLSVGLDRIRWVGSSDGQIPLEPIAAMPLTVPITLWLEHELVVEGRINVAFNERMSDVLDTESRFLALYQAVADVGGTIGDIALNVACITAARER